jgi:hypothetical protein
MKKRVETNYPIKTDAENVYESNMALFTSKWNLIKAADNCGMTVKEMKMTFYEFLKYNPPLY